MAQKPRPRKIIGFGAALKGKSVHVIFQYPQETRANHAFCDPRIKNLIVDKKMKIDKVTCSKCKRSAWYKEQMENVTKARQEAAQKAEEKECPAIPKEKPTEYKKMKDDFEMLPDSQAGKYKIFHHPSSRDFFKGLEANVAARVLSKLQDLEEKWDGIGSCPKAWLSAIIKCRTATYNELEIPISEETKKKDEVIHQAAIEEDTPPVNEETGKPKIRRRRKGEKRGKTEKQIKIRRRKLNPTKMLRRMITKGATLDEMIGELSYHFGYPHRNAKNKIRSVIRHMTRVEEETIIIIQGKNSLKDYFLLRLEETVTIPAGEKEAETK